MKIKIIVNPVAGRKKTLKILPLVLENFKKIGISPDYQITQKEKEATSISKTSSYWSG